MGFAFLFSSLSWRAHGIVHVLDGTSMWDIVVKVDTALFYRCRIGSYILLTAEHS